jgi:hypothetical protein
MKELEQTRQRCEEWRQKFLRRNGDTPADPLPVLTACERVVSSGFLTYPDYRRLRVLSTIFHRHCTQPHHVYGTTRLYLSERMPPSDTAIQFSEVKCFQKKSGARARGTKRTHGNVALPRQVVRCERLTLPLSLSTDSKLQFAGVTHLSARGLGSYVDIRANIVSLLEDEGNSVTTFVSKEVQMTTEAVVLPMPQIEELVLHGLSGLPFLPLAKVTTLTLVVNYALFGDGTQDIDKLHQQRGQLAALKTLHLVYNRVNRIDWPMLQMLGHDFPTVDVKVYMTLEYCGNMGSSVPVHPNVKLLTCSKQASNFPLPYTLLRRKDWPMVLSYSA